MKCNPPQPQPLVFPPIFFSHPKNGLPKRLPKLSSDSGEWTSPTLEFQMCRYPQLVTGINYTTLGEKRRSKTKWKLNWWFFVVETQCFIYYIIYIIYITMDEIIALHQHVQLIFGGPAAQDAIHRRFPIHTENDLRHRSGDPLHQQVFSCVSFKSVSIKMFLHCPTWTKMRSQC